MQVDEIGCVLQVNHLKPHSQLVVLQVTNWYALLGGANQTTGVEEAEALLTKALNATQHALRSSGAKGGGGTTMRWSW